MTKATFKTRREIMGLSVEALSAAMADGRSPGPNVRTIRGWESSNPKYSLPEWAAEWMQARWVAWLASVLDVVEGIADQANEAGQPVATHLERPATTLQAGEGAARIAAITLLLEAGGVPVSLDFDA